MAAQLTDPAFIATVTHHVTAFNWWDYYWVYLFAFAIGFDHDRRAVAAGGRDQAHQVSAGSIGVMACGRRGHWRRHRHRARHLSHRDRHAAALVHHHRLYRGGHQTYFAPRIIIALAYDSGGVTTSTVTVPLGRRTRSRPCQHSAGGAAQLLDGFGLIAFASRSR